jgi:hypothetical protein
LKAIRIAREQYAKEHADELKKIEALAGSLRKSNL